MANKDDNIKKCEAQHNGQTNSDFNWKKYFFRFVQDSLLFA